MTSYANRLLFLFGVIIYHMRLHGLVIWLGRHRPKVALYHDVSESETAFTAGLQCTVRPQAFSKHLDYFAKHYVITRVEDLTGSNAPVRAVAITFDDGYASVYTDAFPILKKHRCPALVYLIGSVIDNASLVWVNELNYFVRVHKAASHDIAAAAFGLLASASPEEIISAARLGYDKGKIEKLLENLRKLTGISSGNLSRQAKLYVDWKQIMEMRQHSITFGNHTATHPNLSRLGAADQQVEIAEAQALLQSKLGSITSFSYPFGHHGSETAGIAAALGLSSVAEVGGSNCRQQPNRIARAHIYAESVAGVFAQMEIVEPVKAAIRALLVRLRAFRQPGGAPST